MTRKGTPETPTATVSLDKEGFVQLSLIGPPGCHGWSSGHEHFDIYLDVEEAKKLISDLSVAVSANAQNACRAQPTQPTIRSDMHLSIEAEAQEIQQNLYADSQPTTDDI